MERSRKIFRRIASASYQVVTAANEYADRKDSNGVPHCHFQLEEDMRKISVACECLEGVLDKPFPEESPAVDARIQDWLNTDEPQQCLHTLSQMESLLQQNSSSWIPWIFRKIQGSTETQDKIKEAVDLFNSCKGCFHFLSSIEIWNNESGVCKQRDVPKLRDHIAQGESNFLEIKFPSSTQTEINATVPLDADVYFGHAEHPTEELNVVVQSLQTPVQDGTITPVPEIDKRQGRRTATQRRHEMKTDKQWEEQDRKLEEILKWLNGLNCAEKQDVTLELRQEDTCEWLFDTTQYKIWKDGENESLWLRGKPGAGKSVLASFVIDSFKKILREGEILVFFYCDSRNERSTRSAEVMRSILSQLLRQLRFVDLGDVLHDLMKAKEWGGGTLSNARELAGFASRAAKLSIQEPVVIVDALDECKDIQKLIRALTMIRGHVRLFVTGRPLHTVVDELSDLPFVSMDDMADELSADIELHVTRELDARQRLRDLDYEFKTDIRTLLCDKADGMFRWVQCSIDTLNRCVTRKEVRGALSSLPNGLDETYERILRAIDMETPAGRLAQRALIWLVAALRPLRLSEVMEGLSINLETRTLDSEIGPMHSGALLDACGSLVTYIEKTGVIILSHSSVKEYLMGELTCTKLQQYHISLERAHLLLARSCMCYISICLKRAGGPTPSDVPSSSAFPQPGGRLAYSKSPLLDYTLDDALDHFAYLGSTFKCAFPDIAVLAEDIQRYSWIWDYVCIPARWEITSSTTKPHWPAARHDLLLYILVAFASNSFMSTFLRRTILNPKEGTNPLVYAAYFNKDEHARTLLSRGARLDHRGWETVGSRQSLPIEVAFRNGHYVMVTHFVEEGSTIPLRMFTDSLFKCYQSNTPSLTPTIPSVVATIFLQADEFAEHMNGCLGETILRAMETPDHLLAFRDVTEQNLIAIIRRLIQVTDGHLAPNSIKEAFFRFAVAQGYLSTAQYIITLGHSLPSNILATLHYYPGRWKTVPMIQFLVENGADVHLRTSSGGSVLHATLYAPGGDLSYVVDDADEGDILGVMRFLVGHGCDPLRVDSYGNTPLHIAVERGYISIAQYLLTLGALLPSDLLVTLDRARLRWSTAPMIHFLVENGVNVLARASDGDSVLHIALRSLYDEEEALDVVKVLVHYGCDVFEPNIRGGTLLHLVVQQGLLSVARYLLTLGARLVPDLLVTLDPARSRWTEPMIHFLVVNGVNILAHASDGGSVLHVALRSLYDDNEALDVAKVLVDYGCDFHKANFRGDTPLHIAVQQGFVSVARYLLTLGAKLVPDLLVSLNRDKWKWITPPMIRFLTGNGANALAHTSDGDSVFHIALDSIRDDSDALEVVKLLIGHGCNPLGANYRGYTPLHIAIERGHTAAARCLLMVAHLPSNLLVMLNRSAWTRGAEHIVHFLAENGADVLARSGNGDSALHIVLQSLFDDEALEAIKVLVDYGCNPSHANFLGKTPLHVAVGQGHVHVAQYLLTLGVYLPPDLLVTLKHGRPRWGTVPVIRFLFENGVNVFAHASDGDSVIHTALQCFNGDKDILEAVKLLISYGCDPTEVNPRGYSPLHFAVERGHLSAARYLLSLGGQPHTDLLFILNRNCSRWATTDMIHLLVENGVTLAHASDGDSVLHIALQCSSCDIDTFEAVQLLVYYGCDPLEANSRGDAPLHVAIERGHVSAAQYLFTLGPLLPPNLLVTLNRARSCWSTAHMIHFLVENGVNILAHASDGDSVLHTALRCFNADHDILEVVKLLVHCGCDPLGSNFRGETPLHIAAERSYISAARYLITQGAGVLAKASNGDTMLHFATSGIHPYPCDEDEDGRVLDAVKYFVGCGCGPAVSNDDGKTPFHNAVARGRIKTVMYLLSLDTPLPPDILFTAIQSDDNSDYRRHIIETLVARGCDTRTPNSEGDTPLQAAVEKGRVDVVEYLLSAMSADNPPLEDLFSAAALAPPSIQSEMRHALSSRRTRSESPDLASAKRIRYS